MLAPGATSAGGGRNPGAWEDGVWSAQATKEHSCPGELALMEAVVGRENMWQALKRVEANKGAPGADNMPVSELRCYLKEHWPRIKEELLAGNHQPAPVRRVEIPKPGGGMPRARHPHGSGPPHPAGHASGAGADLRTRLLRIKLRFQTRPKREAGRA